MSRTLDFRTYCASLCRLGQRPVLAIAALVFVTLAGETGSAVRAETADNAALAKADSSFTRLFDGATLDGWMLVGKEGPGYVVRDGVLVCPADGGGNLFTTHEYSDFAFRFEFRLDKAGNNGVGLRAPLEGDAAYVGMECQILDDSAPDYAHLLPAQYHGSLYKIAAARRGAQLPVGQWNREEIVAIGRRVTVRLNGQTILDANLNTVTDPAVLAEHPGMLRPRGHVGFLGHGPSEVQFRNISIRDLAKPERDNRPPPGFRALFNGNDLQGWKGLVANPPERAKMTPAALQIAERKATLEARKQWGVRDGEITYDGKNDNLCTARDYGDFELRVDWRLPPGGDSGIYLRGSPQVQIWDNVPLIAAEVGSGGLYNNQKHPSNPTRKADRSIGAWNRFDILMIGDRVTVYLNDTLVVQNVPMENYWERDKPIYPTGQIELQHHGGPLGFKNIYLRELPRQTSSHDPKR